MDYLEIILQGYYNENNRDHLVDYFFSEFKKAEKETSCSSDLFFGGCMKVIDAFNANYDEQIYKQQIQLHKYLVSKEENKEEINEVFVKDFKAQIEYQKLNGYTNLRLKNGMMLHLKKNEITYIENAIISAKASIQLKNLPPQQTETKTDKLRVKQIALIHFYEGMQITRENAGDIAAQYGYTSKNSGEGLFQDYTTYSSTANRKGKPTPCTPKKLKNKIELFEGVVKHLSDKNKQRAIDEIYILKTIFEIEFQ